MRTAVKALIKLRVRTHTHTEILLTAVETLLRSFAKTKLMQPC